MSTQNPYCHRPFRSAQYAPQTSAFAVLSVLSGLLAVPLICMCFLSVPFSIAAIIFGHSARGAMRNAPGRYEGFGMATFGMLLGYVTLGIVVAVLSVPLASHSVRARNAAANRNAPNENPLLIQAEDQLLTNTEASALGVSTTDTSAVDLAQHYLEALQILDEHQSEDTGSLPPGTGSAPPTYRAFVQLNEDSAAILLYVPEYNQYSDPEKQAFNDNAWLIAQRTLDEHLPMKSRLALSIYSHAGREIVMTGQTTSTVSAAPKARDKDPRILSSLFRLAERSPEQQASEHSIVEDLPIGDKPPIRLPYEAPAD